MSTINGKVVVITGASSGIGEAAARLLAAKGAHVVMGARRTERLQSIAADIQAAGGSAAYHQLDVTQLEDMQAFIEFAVHTFGHVDVLLNNAGVMPLSLLEENKIDEWNRMIDVNIRGVLHGIAAGLPLMKEQEKGHFINIASIGAYSVTPTAAVYCASKYAVKAITDGLRMETDGRIRVTLISPGVTESELADSISDEHARQAMQEYRSVAIPASAIANAILYAIEQPDEVDVSEMIIRPAASVH
ncbi:SDR family oxidoreductase [Paenibacillus wulumuqiensis]|uniref:SDR family oxidoreductase n=1 Tax=Paenibacillus wulumuqiensis TaxID=1567107 RepID=UPI0006192B9B|nr:SDR family oxidoreductase [Paenibacillus wulumuqiensis]